ncbi:ATP-binding protein [Anatilimnocola sp. NA78]|uniref:PAS domain-containing sensor histidine kinase n=1 Tax=Anatilimnocola sp. NA78 TaxID=3415683 RepID=UPI003CE4BAF7
MNPTTALAFLLTAMALGLSHFPLRVKSVAVSQVPAAIVTAIGLTKLADYLLGLNSGIDRLLFVEQLAGNRMAPNTAAGFAFIGLSLLLLDVRWRKSIFPGEALAACIAVLGLLCLVGYTFSAHAMYGVGAYIPMAANTALAFELLALGILFSRPQRGGMALLTNTHVGGSAARRLLPVAAMVPIALGWLCLLGQQWGLYNSEFGSALMATASVVLLVAAIGWTAAALNYTDRQRKSAESQLRAAFEELDERVNQRTEELVSANRNLAQKNHEIGMFRLLAESVQDYAILMLDRKGKVLTCNSGAETTTGYALSEITGQHFTLLHSSAADSSIASEFRLLAAVESGQIKEVGWRTRKDGSQFWAQCELIALRDEIGQLAGFGNVIRDLTERRQADLSAQAASAELKQRDDQLRQSQKMEAVGTLAGGVAHEFNNLLQAMQAYTRFALEGLDAQEQRYQDLQQVLAAADRAAALTRQLLGFGRRQALELTNVNPNQLIQDLVKLVRPLIGATIAVDVKLDPTVGTIHVDSGHFQQLLMNLCINARDAMADGGTLLIKSEDLCLSQHYCDVHPGVEPGRYLAITVSDTGTGMPPEVLEHIFEPFYTTKGVGKGTGLGLSMVYGMVQQHQGTIRVYSEVGLGTTFRIYLPTVDCEQPVSVVTYDSQSHRGIETILVADDEPLVHDVYVRVLAKAGYRLLTARDGREAWDTFQAHQEEIDLLLLDVVMPHQSGRDVQRKVAQLKPNLPVIFCSGYDPETAYARFTEEGHFPFLQKPCDPDVLLQTVRQVLDQRALCPA